MKRAMFLAAGALLLSACGGPEKREDALSADEEQQLNDAAAMLDEPENEAAPGPDTK